MNIKFLFTLSLVLLYGSANAETLTESCLKDTTTPVEEAICTSGKNEVEKILEKSFQDALASLDGQTLRHTLIASQAEWKTLHLANCELLNRFSQGTMHTSDMIYCITDEEKERIKVLNDIKDAAKD
jgi:uncharacterized protein YecT (DUF1311 family)